MDCVQLLPSPFLWVISLWNLQVYSIFMLLCDHKVF
jgi:hypothetical protein